MDIEDDFYGQGGIIYMDNNHLTAEQLADFGLLLLDPLKDLLLQAADAERALTPDEVVSAGFTTVSLLSLQSSPRWSSTVQSRPSTYLGHSGLQTRGGKVGG